MCFSLDAPRLLRLDRVNNNFAYSIVESERAFDRHGTPGNYRRKIGSYFTKRNALDVLVTNLKRHSAQVAFSER